MATSPGPCDSPAVVSVRVTAKDYGLPRPKSLAAPKPSQVTLCYLRLADCRLHDVHRRRHAGPALERRGALGYEHVEPVHDPLAPCLAGRRDQRRLAPVRLVGHVHDLADAAQVDEELVANGGRVEDEVGVAGRRRPRVVGLDRAVGAQAAQPRGESVRLLGRARGDPERGAACVEERGRNGLRRAAGAEDQHIRALGLDRAGDREPVGARAEDASLTDDECVHGAAARGDLVELVAEREHAGLVRDGDVRALEAERDETGDRGLEALRLDGQRDIGPVEPGLLEGGVLHRRRERVSERVPEQPDEARLAAYPHWRPPRGKLLNSASLAVKKWLRQSGLRTK